MSYDFGVSIESASAFTVNPEISVLLLIVKEKFVSALPPGASGDSSNTVFSMEYPTRVTLV